MKGMLIDKNDDGVFILTKDGRFFKVHKIYNKEIGDEIEFSSISGFFYKRVASIAAALILFTVTLTALTWNTAYGHITVDINPSIELRYNIFNRVTAVEPLNAEGDQMISRLTEYKNMNIEDAVDNIIDLAIENQYIKEYTENVVLIAIFQPNSSYYGEKIEKNLRAKIQKTQIQIELIILSSDNEYYGKAKGHGLSPGKLMLVNQILGSHEELTLKELEAKTINELAKMMGEKNEEQHGSNNDENMQNGYGENKNETNQNQAPGEKQNKEQNGNKEKGGMKQN